MLAGPLSQLPHPFMSFVPPTPLKTNEDEDESLDADDHDDRYGIKDQIMGYVGVRNGPRKKANNFARAVDIKVETFLVMRAAENDGDAFCVPGSNVPLWLAYVHGITAVGNSAELVVTWYVPSGTTQKVLGYFPADKVFYKYAAPLCGNKRKAETSSLPVGQEKLKVSNSELVVINIDKLNGGKKTQGHLPAKRLKEIAKVLLPTSLEQRLSSCPNCTHCPRNGVTVECVECGQLYHQACVGNMCGLASDWLCAECELEEVCE